MSLRNQVLADQIRTEREALVDLLVTLDDEQWTTPSLCAGWPVEDVAAHLAWTPVFAPIEMSVMLVRARFSINGYINQSARRWSERGRDAILSQLRVNARRDAKLIGVAPVAALSEAIVHGYDIRRPLGFAREVPAAAYAVAATWHTGLRPPRTWTIGGDVRSRIAGLRLVADDLAWAWGEGPEVHATGEAMLLMMTGRRIERVELTGSGADDLWARILTEYPRDAEPPGL
ncbi:MAG: maleylpyruvate isomerase family mycothiol-dependent enzyme [Nocardioides sp.]